MSLRDLFFSCFRGANDSQSLVEATVPRLAIDKIFADYQIGTDFTHSVEKEYLPLAKLSGKITKCEAQNLLVTQMNFTNLQELGSGFYGTVYSHVEGERTILSKVNACKVYHFGMDHEDNSTMFDHNLESYTKEVAALRRIDHPNIVKFISSFQLYCDENDSETNFTITKVLHEVPLEDKKLLLAGLRIEKCHCSLRQWMVKQARERLNEAQAKKVFVDIGTALIYLHKTLNMVHCDLKADNIGVMCDKDGNMSVIKLLDFGSAQQNSDVLYRRAEQQSANANLNDLPDEDSSSGSTFSLVPILTGRNPFLLECSLFSKILIQLLTCDLSDTNPHYAYLVEEFTEDYMGEDANFKAVLVRMSPFDNADQVTVEWAMNQML